MSNLVKRIDQAVDNAYYDGRVHIMYMVTDWDGKPLPDIVYPIGHDFELVSGKAARAVIINISSNACKSFGYHEGEYLYDVAFNRRPLMGNFKPEQLLMVFNPDTNVVYGKFDGLPTDFNADESVPLEYEPLKLVAFNDEIIPAKSRAKLSLVK